MVSNDEIRKILPFRAPQIGVHTDLMLVRNMTTGECGSGSCVFVDFQGAEYAVTCEHVLKSNAEYITGAKRLKTPRIEEGESHHVRSLDLIDSSVSLDLAALDRSQLDLKMIPAEAYNLDANVVTYELMARNVSNLSFIYGVPAFAANGLQYPDGLVFMNSPIYTVHGPITSVTQDLIVGDFAEVDIVEKNTEDYPKLKDFEPSGGARHLGGMSGSGLWVYVNNRFHLAGILRGEHGKFDRSKEHLIEFIPVWRLKEWLATIRGAK